MNIVERISNALNINASQIEASIKLIDEGCTIPFIARYRKEVTGNLNDNQLRDLYDKLIYLRSLNERMTTVINSIEEQGKMTDELRLSIDACETLLIQKCQKANPDILNERKLKEPFVIEGIYGDKKTGKPKSAVSKFKKCLNIK